MLSALSNKYVVWLFGFGILLFLGLLLGNIYTLFFARYSVPEPLVLESGSTTSDLITTLQAQDVSIDFYEARFWQRIRSYQVKAGTYQFDTPLRLSTLLKNLDQGVDQVSDLQLVIPEGFSNRKVIERLQAIKTNQQLPKLDVQRFSTLVEGKEGQLFPSTYFLTAETTAESLFDQIAKKYEQELSVFTPAVTTDELILASIIEREVITSKDRRMVANILQRRLDEGMRLQVDATLDYYLDKASDEITITELETDHPYNTYRRAGLPPTPIANPSLDSLQAVREPIANPYYFYLSAPDQTTYFAVDLEGHIENRNLYLRN